MRPILVFLVWIGTLLPAVAEVAIPTLTGPVVDLTGALGPEAENLRQKLQSVKDSTGKEIAVLVVPTTQPEAIEQYATRVFENWKLGRAQIDDGALLLVALQDRAVRIEVGRGFEGDLTDLKSHRIIDEQIIPRFREGDIPGGIVAGVDSILAVVSGTELPPPPTSGGVPEADLGFQIVMLVIIGSSIGQLIALTFGRGPGSIVAGIGAFAVGAFIIPFIGALIAGFVIWLMVLMRDPRARSYSSSRSGGGGGWSSSGGSSSGGFGGGGSSAGGGASGRW